MSIRSGIASGASIHRTLKDTQRGRDADVDPLTFNSEAGLRSVRASTVKGRLSL
jgi:hypothetical protein